jgi:hypothetical protein
MLAESSSYLCRILETRERKAPSKNPANPPKIRLGHHEMP